MAKTTAILTQEDIQTMEKTKRMVWYALLGFIVIACLLAFFILGETNRLYGIGVVLLLGGIFFFVANSTYKKDLTNATKNIYIGTVTKKETRRSSMTENSSIHYFITIDNDEIRVGFSDYDKFSEGKKVELHITETSGTILKLVHL